MQSKGGQGWAVARCRAKVDEDGRLARSRAEVDEDGRVVRSKAKVGEDGRVVRSKAKVGEFIQQSTDSLESWVLFLWEFLRRC